MCESTLKNRWKIVVGDGPPCVCLFIFHHAVTFNDVASQAVPQVITKRSYYRGLAKERID